MKHLSLLLAAAIGVGLSAAFAQAMLTTATPPAAPADWSLGDLQALVPGTTPAVFSQIDGNSDGLVDQAELTRAIETGLVTLPVQ